MTGLANGHALSGARREGEGRAVDAPAVSGRAGRRAAERYRSYLKAERESAELYRRLADASTGDRRAALAELASMEERHAQHWASRLAELGESVPAPDAQRARLRTRILALVARRLSLRAVLPLLERAERADAGMYDGEPAAALGMAREERSHARTLSRIGAGRQAPREPWHRPDKSGSLRAAVFGINDGLVSNTALVMGFAGSGAKNQAILLAGVAGLLAGAFSMGAGEYVSVSSQRELFEREIGLEAEELRDKPEEERRELALIYRAKGLDPAAADEIAEQIMRDRRTALDTMAREELGLDPGRSRLALGGGRLQLRLVLDRGLRRRAAIPDHGRDGGAGLRPRPGCARADGRGGRHRRPRRARAGPGRGAPVDRRRRSRQARRSSSGSSLAST